MDYGCRESRDGAKKAKGKQEQAGMRKPRSELTAVRDRMTSVTFISTSCAIDI